MNLRQKSAVATILATAGSSNAFVLQTKHHAARYTSSSLSSNSEPFYILEEPLQEVNNDLIEKAREEEEEQLLDAEALMEKARALEADAKAWEDEADALEERAKMMLEEQVVIASEEEVVEEIKMDDELEPIAEEEEEEEEEEEVVDLETKLEGGAQMSLRDMLDQMNVPAPVQKEEVIVKEVVDEVAMTEEVSEVAAIVEEEVEQVVEVAGSTTTTSLEEDIQNRTSGRMSLWERLEQINNGNVDAPVQGVASLTQEKTIAIEEVASLPAPVPVIALGIEEVKIEEKEKRPELIGRTMSLKERLSLIEQNHSWAPLAALTNSRYDACTSPFSTSFYFFVARAVEHKGRSKAHMYQALVCADTRVVKEKIWPSWEKRPTK